MRGHSKVGIPKGDSMDADRATMLAGHGGRCRGGEAGCCWVVVAVTVGKTSPGRGLVIAAQLDVMVQAEVEGIDVLRDSTQVVHGEA